MSETFVIARLMLAVAALLVIYQQGFVRQRRDAYRCDIRKLRNDLFDFMIRNQRDFNNPAYVRTRRVLNGLLRLSNDLGPISTLVRTWYKFRVVDHPSQLLPHAEDCDDRALFERLNSTMGESLARTMQFVWFEGAARIVTYSVLAIVRLLGSSFTLGAKARDAISSSAYWVGGPNLDPAQQALLRV